MHKSRFDLYVVPTDQQHYNPEREHNPEFDHEAFLGEEQAREFDQLTPAESRRRLGLVKHFIFILKYC